MSKALIIARRDFKSLVFSPLFAAVAGICAASWSFIYLRAVAQFAQRLQMTQMQGGSPMNIYEGLFFNLISFVHLILIFSVPVLTMRLLSEEKKNRTFDLLLTSPVTSFDIAAGKFLAAFFASLVLILLSFLYPVMTRLVTDFNWMPLITSYLGLSLLVGVYVAIGLFASSLTESSIFAVLLALILNIVLWFLGQAGGDGGTTIAVILQKMSVGDHFAPFIKGSIQINSIVYFLTAIGFFVFMAERVVESSRWRS